MELRAFIAIFITHKKLFFGIILGALFCGVGYYLLQPQQYDVSLTLNVARTFPQNVSTTHDEYNAFYRLQADERFADTVVRWLQSPRIVRDILSHAHHATSQHSLKELAHTIRARRLSSQVIDVRFSVPTPAQGSAQSDAIITVLNTITEDLNDEHFTAEWFHILAQKPVITPAEKPLPAVMLFALFIGFFIGFIVVVFVHYYTYGQKPQQD